VENLYRKYIGSAKSLTVYPTQELKRFIKQYYFYEIRASIPDIPWNPLANGEIELYIHFDKSYLTLLQDGKSVDLCCLIKGIYEFNYNSFVIPRTNKDGLFKGVAIVFTIEGLQMFRDVTNNDLFNKSFEMDDWMAICFKTLIEEAENKSFLQIAMILDAKFMRFYKCASKCQHNPFDAVLGFSSGIKGPLHVDALARECNISYRTLNRYFHQYMGITPKFYLKVLRFNRMCKYLQYAEKINWMDMVHLCGYYDQAHFIHEFHGIMKMCPSEFLKRTNRKFYLICAFLFE
jgi:AraC-like DNA-binding protein